MRRRLGSTFAWAAAILAAAIVYSAVNPDGPQDGLRGVAAVVFWAGVAVIGFRAVRAVR